MDTGAYAEQLVAIGRVHGLDAIGVTTAEPFERARAALDERKDAGLDGGMQFTFRNPSRSTDPRRTLPGARSLIVAARAYPAGPSVPAGANRARVAWYATVDHYAELRSALGHIARKLSADGWRALVLADDNALVDREAAYRAGIGWFGKNANVLLPGHGSWFVLGSVLTDAALPPSAEPAADGCGGCRRCLDGCPTGAIVAPGVIDARRCLAWLVQAEGDFPLEHRAALGDRIYGCDECQLVCPLNRRPTRPAGDDDQERATVDVVALLAATDGELIETFGRWYLPRRDPRYLRRNALVVLGNTGDPADERVRATIRRYRDSDDGMLSAHAAWAAARLGLEVLA
ncbi:MAG: tRNA epoxyqueuosine(34) reductase QueG [Actinobacteria bacterium]|nr:tRNA epoxyqueuosine(34) reductase QueG [Actinomycetota bacterium]